MPLIIEAHKNGAWRHVHTVLPGMDGSMSHNPPLAPRELYFCECAADDSVSTIVKMGPGVDIDHGSVREIRQIAGTPREQVARLTHGQSFKMVFRPDVAAEGGSFLVRFRHKQES